MVVLGERIDENIGWEDGVGIVNGMVDRFEVS